MPCSHTRFKTKTNCSRTRYGRVIDDNRDVIGFDPTSARSKLNKQQKQQHPSKGEETV